MSRSQARPYQLFHLSPPEGHTRISLLALALWRGCFSLQLPKEDSYLDEVFFMMFLRPAEAAMSVCPYYFDQVTDRHCWNQPVRQRDISNLQLRYFDSWANLQDEITRALVTRMKEKPSAYFTQRCRPVTRDPKRILSCKDYLHRMKGFQS